MPVSLTAGESRACQQVVQRLAAGSLVKSIRMPRITGTDTEPELQHVRVKIRSDANFGVDTGKLDTVWLGADERFAGEETGRIERFEAVGRTGQAYAELVSKDHVTVVPTVDFEVFLPLTLAIADLVGRASLWHTSHGIVIGPVSLTLYY